LQREGYELYEASDGLEALEQIHACRPHIVLLDMLMPNMDGVDCCKRIKRDPSLKGTKTVIVTTKSNYASVSTAFKAGCDDYITKPVSSVELISKVDELAKLIRSNTFVSELSQEKTRSPSRERRTNKKQSPAANFNKRDVLMEQAKAKSLKLYELSKQL
jgi:two-component system alkaline phosphatase synthesis response regulator PhoP